MKNKHFNETHGLSQHPLFPRWSAMMRRCYRPSNPKFARYGARGVVVCERWHNPANFIADMGNPPTPKHTLDRIDVNGPYSPENCRWATQKVQQNNRENTWIIQWRGERLPITEWAKRTGISSRILRQRIGRDGWPAEKALTLSVSDGALEGRRRAVRTRLARIEGKFRGWGNRA